MPDAHAVIDIGSGSTSVAVFRREGTWIKRVYQEGLPLRLMRKIDATGALSGPAVRASVAAVCAFIDHAQGRGAATVQIVGTSVLRDARNGADVLAKIEAATGIQPRLVSGEEEGRLAAEVVVRTLPIRDGIALDLGGGSMQLVRIQHGEIADAVSLRLGALRMTASFLANEPPTGDSLCALRRHAVNELSTVSWLGESGLSIVAAGGSARTIAKVSRKAEGSPAFQHGDAVHTESILDLTDRLSRMSAAERTAVPSMPLHRVETIVAATVILSAVLRLAGTRALMVSSFGIREALAARALLGPHADSPISRPTPPVELSTDIPPAQA